MKPSQAPLEYSTEQPSSVMSLLKSATSEVHRQLERNRCLSRLFQPDYSLTDYTHLIAKFYGFFAAIEPLIFGDLDDILKPMLAHRVKTGLLVRDLIRLGIDESHVSTLSMCRKLPQLNGFSQRMGALYVLEGSTLGGRIISTRLKTRFGESVSDKLNFYQSYGADLMSEWSDFQNFMASHFDGKDREMDDCVNAAIDTFLCLDNWLQQA